MLKLPYYLEEVIYVKKFVFCLLLLASFWSARTFVAAELVFSAEEEQFIKNNPVIRLGVDPLFVPFEFIDESGRHQGLAADYLDLIAQRTGLEFQVTGGLSWPEAYDLALAGQLDLLPAVGKTPEREEFFLLSQPYYYFKRALAIRDDASIHGLPDLAGEVLAVQRNSSHHSYLLQHEKINLSLYDSVEAGLAAVATGRESAFLGNLATINYLVKANGLTGLRLIAYEAEKQQALHLAVRRDWPELASILDKGISDLTEQEKSAISSKWIELDTKLDFTPFIRAVSYTAAFFLIIGAVSGFWIKRLKKEIRRHQKTQIQLEVANEELAKISMLDGLTGISNRRYFDTFLKQLWGINMREKFPLALIMIDIDDFKKFNDRHGHLAGDACLRQVADIISQTVTRAGDFVARYGGEEFAVLLSNTKEDGAFFLADKIRQNIAAAFIKTPASPGSITASFGVAALVSSQKISPADLISAADRALYQAKASGKNCVARASQIKDPDDHNSKEQVDG